MSKEIQIPNRLSLTYNGKTGQRHSAWFALLLAISLPVVMFAQTTEARDGGNGSLMTTTL